MRLVWRNVYIDSFGVYKCGVNICWETKQKEDPVCHKSHGAHGKNKSKPIAQHRFSWFWHLREALSVNYLKDKWGRGDRE